MKTAFKLSLRTLLLVLLLSNYATICSISCLSHNHEFDGSFHDNCPACQWDTQSQAENTSVNAVLEGYHDPLVYLGQVPLIQSHLFIKQTFLSSNFSRAPPAIA